MPAPSEAARLRSSIGCVVSRLITPPGAPVPSVLSRAAELLFGGAGCLIWLADLTWTPAAAGTLMRLDGARAAKPFDIHQFMAITDRYLP
jgi:hypothetical protein